MTIRSDDPKAVEKLQQQLEKRIRNATFMRNVNKHLRADNMSALRNLGLTDEQIERLKDHKHHQRPGFQPWEMQGNNQRIKQIEKRIADIERSAKVSTEDQQHDGFIVRANTQINRVQIVFDDKPGEVTRSWLKRNGFKWSGRYAAWQRHNNDNGRAAVDRFVSWSKITENA